MATGFASETPGACGGESRSVNPSAIAAKAESQRLADAVVAGKFPVRSQNDGINRKSRILPDAGVDFSGTDWGRFRGAHDLITRIHGKRLCGDGVIFW